MKENEELLSKDPIGAFDTIKNDYLRYFNTMYQFKDTSLEEKKKDAVKRDGNLSKEPYCEILPKYQSEDKSLSLLCDDSGDYYTRFGVVNKLPEDFADFIKAGLMDYPPYRHQFEMLCKGFGKGKNILITSGTGSGKTESFMLPLIASLLSESQKWNSPVGRYSACWWNNKDADGNYIPCQRQNETRPAAIRSLLLYPMNALVADQVARLRKALDSDLVRDFFEKNCNDNRIFFGSYNSKTVKAKSAANYLLDINRRSEALRQNALSGRCDADDVYVSPRLSDTSFTAEMLVREDMQNTPPDILITNVSMLSIMLMRYEEQGMLSVTKSYFENNPDAVFHLIVDELHLHRGTAGAEVAYLLRMFLERIGVPPMKDGHVNPQLRIYASSASLGDNAQSYLSDFFGVFDETHDVFTIQQGYNMSPVVNRKLSIDYSVFDTFYNNNSVGRPYYLQTPEEKTTTENEFISRVGFPGTFKDFVSEYSGDIYDDLKHISNTTFRVSELSKLPGEPSIDAIRGFFIFRGAVKHNSLPNIRFHQFYRYIDGLWGELQPDKMHDGPVGEVLFHPSEISSNGSHKVLELLRCECCGEMFFGGNRAEVDGKTIMSLNSPNLDGIPNYQATPMVQKKKITEYAVFWPSQKASARGWYSSNPENAPYERFGLVNSSSAHTKFDTGTDDAHGAWREAFLNPYDGSVSILLKADVLSDPNKKGEYIHGYIYTPRNNSGTIVTRYRDLELKAMPCKCPACDKDYLYRKYTQSPIRSFRTGMGRNNQMFSKELLYQLDSDGKHLPKLVGFSDSRQDAADQSKLISREHHRDMLRLIFMNLIESKASGASYQQLDQLKQNICFSLYKTPWSSPKTPGEVINDINIYSGVTPTDKNALINIVNSGLSTDDIISEVNSYIPTNDAVDLNTLISKSSTNIDGDIVREMLRLGINPAGTEKSDTFPACGNYWDSFYDFNNLEMIRTKYQTRLSSGRSLGESVHRSLVSKIFANCFGQYMNVNTEVAGLGYVASADITGKVNAANLKRKLSSYLDTNGLTVEGVIDSFIRIYGDNYRYDSDFDSPDMPNYDDFSKPLKKAVEKLATLSGIDKDELGRLISSVMIEVATDQNGKLDLTKLRFVIKHSGDEYYQCTKCGRIHLHRGLGVCTNTACLTPLPLTTKGKVDALWKTNYISHDVKKHAPKRLHSEELTGQTDNQTERLLEFKDIMIADAKPISRSIDMLNVTTTMEVGVDIGSLQAIYQGNMPPTRYNYQQRVGRAGRRNQAYSAALTFCRGRSHDNYYYYKATEEITGGIPADPTISVNPIICGGENLVILKRVILKHILRIISADRSDWALPSGTSGQLGGRGSADWDSVVMPEISDWICENQDHIKTIIKYYTSQYIPEGHVVNKEIFEWVVNHAVSEMDSAVKNNTLTDNAQAIAEAGLLPTYGMPSTVRNLYHTGTVEGELPESFEYLDGVIDRPVEQAISEFSPGSIKTKDSAEYQSAGLTVNLSPMIAAKEEKDLVSIEDELDPLQHSYNLNLNGAEINSITKYDKNLVNETTTWRLVIPKAFRTDKIIDNLGDSVQEDDSRSNFTPVEIWVDAKAKKPTQIDGGAAQWEVWNGSNSKGDVWYINTNDHAFFKGQRATRVWGARSNGHKYVVEPRYLTHYITNSQTNNGTKSVFDYAPNFMFEGLYEMDKWEKVGNPERIALGARKCTDILCLSLNINKIPSCLNLNTNTGNKSAIIAAFYSAATLIQRTFADQIDIQPEEIEISEIKIDPVNGLPSIYMNDCAPNGAGFISLLCMRDSNSGNCRLEEIMRDIVSTEPKSRFIRAIRSHNSECKTSCPKCLNTFYNRGLHHVLDWRLGMDVIKLMLDETYDMGYSNLNNTPYGDLSVVLNELGARVQSSDPSGNTIYHENDGNHWMDGYFKYGKVIEHLVHPLWNVSEQESSDGFYSINMFNLQRGVKPQPKRCMHVDTSKPTTVPQVQPQDVMKDDEKSSGNGGYGILG